MPCVGNSSEFCGGPNRLNVYNLTDRSGLPPVTTPVPPGGGGGSTTPVFPVSTLPAPWTYAACYVDDAFGRVFQTELPDNSALTVESCIVSCSAQNFTLIGLEFSVCLSAAVYLIIVNNILPPLTGTML